MVFVSFKKLCVINSDPTSCTKFVQRFGYYAQLKSDVWRGLSGSVVRVWLELHTRYHGDNNGKLTLPCVDVGLEEIPCQSAASGSG